MNKATPVVKAPTVDEYEEDTETAIEPAQTDEPSSPRDLNSLREIIFGPTIREYSTRFRTIDRELERMRRQFEERYTDLDMKLSQRFEELNSELHKRLREIDKQINERIDQIVSKGEIDLRKLSTLIDTLAQDLQEKIDKINSGQSNQVAELRDQMRRNYDTLRSELVTETDALDENKLNRFALADSLIELGMKLKDQSLLEELNTQLSNRTD